MKTPTVAQWLFTPYTAGNSSFCYVAEVIPVMAVIDSCNLKFITEGTDDPKCKSFYFLATFKVLVSGQVIINSRTRKVRHNGWEHFDYIVTESGYMKVRKFTRDGVAEWHSSGGGAAPDLNSHAFEKVVEYFRALE